MRIIDLSQTLENNMPIFPGDPPPRFAMQGDLRAGDAYTLTRLEMTAHTGTHVDCPAHVIAGGFTVDDADLTRFFGRGLAVDCSAFADGRRIPAEAFKSYDLTQVQFVLVYCGWDKHPGTAKLFADYPVLSKDAAEYLANMENIRGIGVEYSSIDPIDCESLTLHRIMLGKDKCIVENLCNIDKLLGKDFVFAALPLKIGGGEGAPARAAAILAWE